MDLIADIELLSSEIKGLVSEAMTSFGWLPLAHRPSDTARAQLQQQLQDFPHEHAGTPVVLIKAHLKDALQRCIKGEITAQDLESWAELLVGRPGIDHETGSESKPEAVLFQISTPEINAPLSAITCWRLLKELQ